MSVLSPAQDEFSVTSNVSVTGNLGAVGLGAVGPGAIDPAAIDPEEAAHEPPSDLICSARGCRGHADWALRWNNPRLHTPARRKTWLACTDHREYLEDFLSQRGFLRETVDSQAISGC